MERKSAMQQIIGLLEKYLSMKTVIGDPLTLGDLTLIPVLDVMFGFGAGEGESQGGDADGDSGSGGGAGARIAPKAVIVVKGGDVQVLPLNRGGTIEKIVEALPGLMEKFHLGAPKSAPETQAE